MSFLLTTGGIHKIFNTADANSLIFQVLTVKTIHNSDHDNFVLKLSDGAFCSSRFIAGTQLNYIAQTLTPKSRIRVNRYICHENNEKRKVVIILDMDILVIGRENHSVIKNPTRYESSLPPGASTEAPSNGNDSQILTREFEQPGTSGVNQSSLCAGRSSGASESVRPIISLSPYKDIWTILARVTNKSKILPYKSVYGEGIRFFFDLHDETGEIRATVFNEFCDQFYDMIEVNKVYYITFSKLHIGDREYNPRNKDYEIIFDDGTKVRLCETETDIPCKRFTFVEIDKLETIEFGKFVDVIGICKDISDVLISNQRDTGRELKRRNVQIVDHTGKEVQLTLWGFHAEDFNGPQNSVIAVKDAKVMYFCGRNLSVTSISILLVEPDIEEKQRLRTWYETVGHTRQIENFPTRANCSGRYNNIKMIGEALALAENLGYRKRVYCFVKATIIKLQRNCMYQACPLARCAKKVTEMTNGVYYCQKCNREYDSFSWRYMLKVNIADGTDSVWVTLFQDQAETLLGFSPVAFEALRVNDENSYHAILDSLLFREKIFRLKMLQTGSYRDTIVESVEPLNYQDYNKVLLTQLAS